MAKIADLEKQIAELQQRRDDVQVVTIAYDNQGRILAALSTTPDTVAALKLSKAVFSLLLHQTDALLLAAVEREAKADGGD